MTPGAPHLDTSHGPARCSTFHTAQMVAGRGAAPTRRRAPATSDEHTREHLSMNQPWRAKAACRGLEPTIFYPDPDVDEDALPAKAVCAECQVRESCLEYALGFREKDGVWGGCTERERRRIIRQRRRSA